MGDRGWLLPRDEAGAAEGIGTDVRQHAPTGLGVVADVAGIVVKEREVDRHVAQPPQAARLHDLSGAYPLGVMDDHEGFGRQQARGIARGDQLLIVLRLHRHRLFT